MSYRPWEAWAAVETCSTGQPVEPGTDNSKRSDAPGFVHLVVQSPGYDDGDLKNQDRASWWPDMGIAAVCDGTGSSPYSEEAAEFVIGQAPSLFVLEGRDLNQRIATIVEGLLERREAVMKRPAELPLGISEAAGKLMLDTVATNRKRSYQTTVVAARIQQDTNKVRIHYYKCGDSELFVFGPHGTVVFTTYPLQPGLQSEDAGRTIEVGDVRFWNRPPTTPVLPDSYADYASAEKEFPSGVTLLLGSDGLFEAFAGSRELHAWLVEHKDILNRQEDDGSRKSVLEALHRRLMRGDDDVSLVWIETLGVDEAEDTVGGMAAGPAAVTNSTSPQARTTAEQVTSAAGDSSLAQPDTARDNGPASR